MKLPKTVRVWLSFADASRPRGQTFLGVCIVEVPFHPSQHATFRTAMDKTHQLGINPGGQVQMFAMDPDAKIPDNYMNRLLDKQTLESSDLGESTSG